MDLPQRNQPEDVLALGCRADERFAICRHDLAVIGIGKTQIQIETGFAGPVNGCFSADPGAESMDQPGEVRLLLPDQRG